jgi:catalase
VARNPKSMTPPAIKSGETPRKAPKVPPGTRISESYAETQGSGGETHQIAGNGVATLTTQQGIPVADDQNSLKQGPRGPILMEDHHYREKIFHFDHERIPERVVHARGYGAHGFFELTESLADITRADVFQRVGERVPAFVRFSTVAGSKGSFDWRAMSAALPSSSTPTKATGISSATTSRCSSSRIPSSSRT